LVAVVIAGLGYYLFNQFFMTNKGNVNSDSTGDGRRVITNYGESILNDDRYVELRPFDQPVNLNQALDHTPQRDPFK